MGMNTPVLILNDAWHEIENDPQFGRSLYEASMKASRGQSADARAGNYMNGAQVLSYAHADNVRLIAMGGNHATELLSVWNGGHHYELKDQIELVKALADKYGYRLVRKSK